MKRILSFILIVCMAVALVPPSGSYAVESYTNYPNYSILNTNQQKLIQQQFVLRGTLKNIKGDMYIALKPLELHQIVVYNYPSVCATALGVGRSYTNPKTGKVELQYLGYDLNGKLVTNDYYTNGPIVGERDPLQIPNFTYEKIPEAYKSWKNASEATKSHMLNKPFISLDEYGTKNPQSLSIKQVLDNSIQNKSDINEYYKRLLMQSEATAFSDGSMRTYYRGWNTQTQKPVKSYNTFTVEKMIPKSYKPTVSIAVYDDAACQKPITVKDIMPGQDKVIVYVKIKTDASLNSIGLERLESKYLESVTNTYIGAPKTLTDFSAPTNMFSVFPLILNRKDYKREYTDKNIEGTGLVKSKADVIKIEKMDAAKTILKVRAIDPSIITPDFQIYYATENKTDGGIQYDKDIIDIDFTFDLKDQTYLPPDIKIEKYNWFALNYETNQFDDYFGWTKDSKYTMTPEKAKRYFKYNTITIMQRVVDQYSKTYEVKHTVRIGLETIPPNPQEAKPTAFVNAPGTIRAGKRCGISGEGTSPNGPILSYDFDIGSGFSVLKDELKEKEGTFLSFDHSDRNDYEVTTTLTVTDPAGKSASDKAKTFVKHPIEAVFKTNGIYKVNRTIELDSTESTGTEYYPIDKVTWTIRPMDGQFLSNIKTWDASRNNNGYIIVEGAKPKVDFKQLGRYEVWMDVHSTCTFPGETNRTASKQVYGIINIQPDTPPVAKLSIPSKTIREFEDAQQATITIWDESYSTDGDNIGKRRFFMRFDTNNNKRTDDEAWQLVYDGLESHFDYKTPNVGYYEFKVEVEEANDSVNSPFWNPVTDVLKANTDSQPLVEKQGEVLNTAPITSIIAERKKLDLVLVTDYEGADYSALKTELDLLTKDLFEKGVDINVQLFTDKVRNGSVKAPLYHYARYAHVNYTTEYTRNADIQYQTKRMDDRFIWESKIQLETDYLPTLAPIPATFTTSWYNKADPACGVQVNQGMTVKIDAPTDPYLKSGSTDITTELVYSNQYNSGLEKRQNMRDMSVAVDNYYVKENVVNYADIALYTMNLDLLRQTVNYREGSDRQMIFVMKTGDSLTTLNQAFSDYVKQNDVVVSAVNGFDMSSQYGGLAIQNAEFIVFDKSIGNRPGESYNIPGWIQSIKDASVPIGVAYQTEDGKTFKNNSFKDANYPLVHNGYTFRTNNFNEYRGFNTWNRFYGENTSYEQYATYYSGISDYQMPDYPRQNIYMYNTANDNTTYTVSGSRGRGEDKESYSYTLPMDYNGLKKVNFRKGSRQYDEKAYFIRNGNLYTYDIPYNNQFDKTLAGARLEAENCEIGFVGGRYAAEYGPFSNILMINYKSLNKSRIIWQTTFSETNSRGDWYTDYKVEEVWVDGLIKTAVAYSTGPNTLGRGRDNDYGYEREEYAPTVIDILTTTGVSKRLKAEGIRLDKYRTRNVVHVVTMPNGMKPMNIPEQGRRQFDDFILYWNSYVKAHRDTDSSITSYFMSEMGDIWKTNGYWDANGNLYFSPVTQGLNIKKYSIYKTQEGGYATLHLVALSHDGKLYSAPISNQLLTPQSMTNLVKDPRTLTQPVVNAMSMRKLLNQSSANRISGSFGEFGNRLRADYDYLKYQTRVTLLLDETLSYDKLYYDREGDVMHDSGISIQHDQGALENPIGTDVNNGKLISNWNGKLAKTGLYKIQPKVQDSPNSDDRFSDYRLWNKDDTTVEVLVHRKPIASMRIKMTNVAPYMLTAADSNSKDLDHESQPNRGIIAVEWGIKKLYDDAWEISRGPLNTGMTKALETGETYIVSYRVKDVEGEWSDPVTEQIVAGMNLLLDAKIRTENPEHSLTKFQTGNNVIFHDLWTSYPLAHHLEIQMYDGQTPIFNKVTLHKDWGNVRVENYPERDWHDVGFNIPRTINGVPLADKSYSFVVTAFDSSNPNIKKQKTFQVTTVSNSAPTVSFTRIEPSTLYEGDSVQVRLKVDDPDKDRLNLQIYIAYDNQGERLLETHQNVAAGSTIVLKAFELPKAKLLKLRAVVTDPMNAIGEAKAERAIQALGIETATLTGAWNHWRGQVNAFGQQMSNEPYRFLAYEKVSMTITTRGEPDQLSLRLEAPLEAMRYVDSKGNVYTYKEEIGSDVSFPIIFRQIAANKYYLEYILPLANSTISWEGQRKRPPYQLYVTLAKDGRSRLVVFGDEPGEACIDMTGNIFDLVYNQPTKPKK